MLSAEIITCLTNKGWVIHNGKQNKATLSFIEADLLNSFYSIEIDFNGTDADLIRSIQIYMDRYDVFAELDKYIPYMGRNGIPDSSKGLYQKLEDIRNQLILLVDDMESVLYPTGIEEEDIPGNNHVDDIPYLSSSDINDDPFDDEDIFGSEEDKDFAGRNYANNPPYPYGY